MSQSTGVSSPCTRIVKLAVVGAGGVGKSTLIARLTTGAFIDKNMTVGFDVESWTVDTGDDSCVKCTMFDFGGQKQFRFFQGALVMGAKAALIVFDCSSFRSLMQIDEWMGLIEGVPPERRLLVGTKTDVDRSIPEEAIRAHAQELGLNYVLVSSKTGANFSALQDRLEEIARSC
ncbi:MAG: GTP-binding protein [Candidatus Thorarchaeota archaeon]